MLTFKRDQFSDAMDKAARIANKRSPRDLTRWVLIEAKDGSAVITATDCEVGVKLTCPCDGPPMETLIPGGLVASFLKSMTGDEVTLEIEDDKAVLSDKTATFRPPVRDPKEFVGWTTPANSISLDAYRFKPAVRRTAWAADDESTRYALGGVLMDLQPGVCALAATDSRCLAVETFEVPDSEVEWKGVIPSQAIAAAAPLMGGTFQFHYGDKAVEFVGIDSSYYARLVEGRFPNYQDVLPKGKFPCEIVFGRDDLLQLVNQSLMVTAVETRGVDFEIMDRVLVASCGSEEKGKFAGRLAVAFDGRIGVTLDPSFLREFLTRLEPDCKVLWGIGGSDKANRFTVEGLNWQAVVMPLARE